MSSQDLEVYAAAFATYDGLYTRLRTQAELLREGVDNISVIKTLLDMTIPKDPTSFSIAGALQFLANGREPAALLQSLFKERRACLLLLLNGEAVAKALMVEDLVEIIKGTDGYSITRLVDGGRVRMPTKGVHSGARGHPIGSARSEGGHSRGGHGRGGHSRGGGSRTVRDNAAMGANGSLRGGHGANSYRVRSTRGDARAQDRTYDRVPFQMSPEMAEDIIEKYAKESIMEEFPLPSRPLSYSATLTPSGTLSAPLPSESVSIPVADKSADTAVTPAAVTPAAVTPAAVTPAAVTPAAVTPAAVTPAAVTPVTITVRKGRGKATAPTPQAAATAAVPAAISVPVTPPVSATSVPATPMAPATPLAPQKINWCDINDEVLFDNP
jgi:hypothetical protein